MIINELFNTQIPYTRVDSRTVTFQVGDNTYAVWFEPSMDYDDAMEVSFGLQNGTNSDGVAHYTQYKTGTGNEMSVFGAVTNIVREFMGMTNMTKLAFSARKDETSRVKLYDKMIPRLAPDWKLEIGSTNSYKTYLLTKPTMGDDA